MKKLFFVFTFLSSIKCFAQINRTVLNNYLNGTQPAVAATAATRALPIASNTSVQNLYDAKNYLTDPVNPHSADPTFSSVHNGATISQDMLVADFAFRKLIKSNFNSLVLGNENIAKIGRYASVNISDKTSFEFSPIVIEDNDEDRNYHNIVTVNFSGKLNSNQYLNLKDWREVGGSVTWTHILGLSTYVPIARANTLQAAINCKRRAKITELIEKYLPIARGIDELTPPPPPPNPTPACAAAQKNDMATNFINDYIDMEIETAEDYWHSKNLFWYSFNFNILSFDNFMYVDSKTFPNGYSPTKEKIYTPSITASLNYYEDVHGLFVTLFGGGKLRHSLSEVYKPDDFQNYEEISNSVLLLKDIDNVFVTDFSTIQKRVKFDYGGRFTKFFKIPQGISPEIKFGLNFSFSSRGLVSDMKNSTVNKVETGIIIPLKNSQGETKFNFEVFHRWDSYHNFPNENEKAWGLRFNVPISN